MEAGPSLAPIFSNSGINGMNWLKLKRLSNIDVGSNLTRDCLQSIFLNFTERGPLQILDMTDQNSSSCVLSDMYH